MSTSNDSSSGAATLSSRDSESGESKQAATRLSADASLSNSNSARRDVVVLSCFRHLLSSVPEFSNQFTDQIQNL